MNRETKLQIFQHYPEVYEAYKAEEGKKKMERDFWEKEFWEKYFRTYIVEDQRPLEDGTLFALPLTLDTNLFAKYKKKIASIPRIALLLLLSLRNAQKSAFPTLHLSRWL